MKVREISYDAINLDAAEKGIERALAVLEDIRHLPGAAQAIGRLEAAKSDLYGEMPEEIAQAS